MEALVFIVLLVALSWLIGWAQGHRTGVLEGRALRELQAAYERPLLPLRKRSHLKVVP